MSSNHLSMLLAISVLIGCSTPSISLPTSEPLPVLFETESDCGNGRVEQGEPCDFMLGYVRSETQGAYWACNQQCNWEIGAVPTLTVHNGTKEHIELNSDGQIARKWSDSGTEERYAYDSWGQRIGTITIRGDEYETTRFDYDSQGRVTREWSEHHTNEVNYSYNEAGSQYTQINSYDGVEESRSVRVYHSNGKLMSLTTGDLTIVETYNKKGWRTGSSSTSEASNAQSEHKHDDRGNVIESITRRSLLGRKSVHHTTNTYDPKGHLTKRVEKWGSNLTTELFSYDAGGRLLRHSSKTKDDAEGDYLITYTYDKARIALQRSRPKPTPGISFPGQTIPPTQAQREEALEEAERMLLGALGADGELADVLNGNPE